MAGSVVGANVTGATDLLLLPRQLGWEPTRLVPLEQAATQSSASTARVIAADRITGFSDCSSGQRVPAHDSSSMPAARPVASSLAQRALPLCPEPARAAAASSSTVAQRILQPNLIPQRNPRPSPIL